MTPYHYLPIQNILSFLADKEPFALLETTRVDSQNLLSYIFFEPDGKIEINNYSDLPLFFNQIESLLLSGYYLAGFFSYEAGNSFNVGAPSTCPPKPWQMRTAPAGSMNQAATVIRSPSSPFPLACFYLFRNPLIFDHQSGLFTGGSLPEESGSPKNYTLKNPLLTVGFTEYQKNVRRIKELIAAGDTYQVNYTLKCKFNFSGSSFGLYRDLRERQTVAYSAFIKDRDFSLLSFSPELFFRKSGRKITVRPMKGTIGRGKDACRDKQQIQLLEQSPKERSENVMIVDLLRSDLGRVSEVGTVRTDSLFDIEEYETLFQMTSTISGILKENLSFGDLFEAIFPSGSVTGAPKIRTMEIIRELEKEERAVYTGAVGVFFPNRDAIFNVAIRTMTITGAEGEMGIGGGITFGSDARQEYDECKLKALFLTDTANS
ncbi:MAG: aminodeoxychorismate synthase component I [Candidatus Omnitrophica bacterium]|nr:aminodeoxychorismate synthase component I [Candidatus Omnitrophota bacterium]